MVKRQSDVVISADMFFEDESGEYNWVEDKLRYAHEWCNEKVVKFMRDGIPRIYVANVFDRECDVDCYAELARSNGYSFFSIVMENRSHTKTIHGVNDHTILRMKDQFKVKLV